MSVSDYAYEQYIERLLQEKDEELLEFANELEECLSCYSCEGKNCLKRKQELIKKYKKAMN